MDDDRDFLRQRLLDARGPADLKNYRQFVVAAVEKDQTRIRRERVLATLFWIFCAGSATVWLWFSADAARLPRGPFLACIFFTWGGVEVVKHYINACRIDLLKEIKQVQLQLFELAAPQQDSGGFKSA
jgi:hypothetical protein